MTKDVLVTISGLAGTSETEDDVVEVTTGGSYYYKNGKHYILYEEVGDHVDDVVKNTIVIGGHHVDVRKKGAVEAQLSFEEGKKLNSIYGTVFGQMELGVYTDRIEMTQEERLMELHLDYHLEINNEPVSDNKIHILIQAME